ncbi:MAG: GNAT family N-acetyltransferase [Planctomycetota bacterium]
MLDLARSLQMRPFELADAGTVEPWLTGPGLSLPGGALRREWPQRLLSDARIVARIAETGGRKVGLVRLDWGPDGIAELTLVVAPDSRRLGHGTAMFAGALQVARQMNLRRLLALVDIGNRGAIEFFGEQGFVAEGMLGSRIRLTRLVHAGGKRPLEIEP